jgi:hypothetical protein
VYASVPLLVTAILAARSPAILTEPAGDWDGRRAREIGRASRLGLSRRAHVP